MALYSLPMSLLIIEVRSINEATNPIQRPLRPLRINYSAFLRIVWTYWIRSTRQAELWPSMDRRQVPNIPGVMVISGF